MKFFTIQNTLLHFLIHLITLSCIQSSVIIRSEESSKFIQALAANSRSKRQAYREDIVNVPITIPRTRSSNLLNIDSEITGVEQELDIKFQSKCETCKVQYMQKKIRVKGCETTKITLPICSGLCLSWEIPHYKQPYYKRRHNVCQPIKVIKQYFTLNGCSKRIGLQVPSECTCAPCNPHTTSCRFLH